ncbi:ATP-dependent rRNA helicase spb4 [Xylona heveae TC161]|uniref:RNA helicase n=1 Tax=Xylona heveae (strain CBS 132557 / TC161) TaxID=1328760 RepID=A0A165IR77_XYLHT|nr:ATP-dependent rRNA helicase spb4 [Xylona heveae TC161]KZF25268.1 ATP-dependent rRNA helicase spb4 [Xylona heveae TC161]
MAPTETKGAAKPPSSGSSRAWDGLTPALSEWALDAVSSMGFSRMTPVQASTIPLFMGYKDVVVEAVTGSGKTLAFLIPIVERLLRLEEPIRRHHIGAIIISPTRELATQIYTVLLSLLSFHGPSAAALNPPSEDTDMPDAKPNSSKSSDLKVVPQLILGGTTTPAQDLSSFLKNSPNLIISTPGRLLELLSSPHVHCPQSSFEVLVLDEADRLLDMGFKEDLQKILSRLPKQRRTGLFSASVSEAVDQIVRVGLRNPVRIAVKVRGPSGAEDRRTPASLQMTYLTTPASHKIPALSQLLGSMDPTPQKTIVYVSTCAGVDYLQHLLPALLPTVNLQKIDLVPLHGKHAPNVRQKNFTRFVNSIAPTVLLTTDVAARGLDIPQVDLVVQLDPPGDPKAFLHRCGRAGRAGRRGLSVVFLHPGREEDYVPFLDVRKTPVTPLEHPTISTSDEDAKTATATLRKLVLTDRGLHDKAQRAFVSWVRAYTKHQASSIFRVADLDWRDLADAWGLLRLPKMPELRGWQGDRFLGLQLDFENFAYKDKQHEKVRKKELQQFKETQATRGDRDTAPQDKQQHQNKKNKKNQAWSNKTELKERREERREKKKTRRDAERSAKMTPAEREKQEELQALLKEVKQKNNIEDEEFDGFDD